MSRLAANGLTTFSNVKDPGDFELLNLRYSPNEQPSFQEVQKPQLELHIDLPDSAKVQKTA